MGILSFIQDAEKGACIRNGDLVIVYERFDSMKALTVADNEKYQNRFGIFDMNDWVGLPFGSRVVSNSGSGHMYLLAPTPELWTIVLKHRTQILYLADIATVCCQLELRPGSIVLESGTGSGSLTTSLARAVSPTGQVHTFEFHEQRSQLARDEFIKNGVGHLVTVQQRNIEQDGFPEILHGQADAVFLDLPGPWKAIPSVSKCLRTDGVFCGFSPCIEQVQRTCEALNANGFKEMRTMEILLREYDVGGKKIEDPDVLIALLQQQQNSEQVNNIGTKDKKQKREGGGGAESAGKGSTAESEAAEGANGKLVGAAHKSSIPVARPISEGRGHTGYLTFARKTC